MTRLEHDTDPAPAPPAGAGDATPTGGLDVIAGRRAEVGGLPIARVLPTRGRRTVGAWCFVDLMGPADGEDPDPMEVGPHPHIGLSTVTWLLEGEAVHRDSLGTEQVLRPGQLNLMTAGRGISHSEVSVTGGRFAGVQLWVAQPDATRHDDPAFEHHAELPLVEASGVRARVLVGDLLDGTAPSRADTPMLGAEVVLEPGIGSLPLDPTFEHAVVPLTGTLAVDGQSVPRGSLGLLPPGHDELPFDALEEATFLLLGGVPFESEVAMFWNFVARDRDELTAAFHDWAARHDRFGSIDGPMERIEAPAPPWLRT